jgi:hypothetical protein
LIHAVEHAAHIIVPHNTAANQAFPIPICFIAHLLIILKIRNPLPGNKKGAASAAPSPNLL